MNTYKRWTEIRQEFETMQCMSCVPKNIHKVSERHIFDENKSVKWNKEQVQRNNEDYLKEVARLNTEKNKFRDSIYNDIFYTIKCEVGHNLSIKKAEAIWGYVYDLKHSSGIADVIEELQSLIELVDELLS